MNIKNYTSGIASETSVSRIESKLAACGASGIMKLYGPDKKISAIVFEIPMREKAPIRIKIPANVETCFQAMWKQHCLSHSRPRENTKATIREQANRTAWKLVQDWVEVQISMIVMQQAEFLEVFLPYIWDGRQTYFESIRAGGFKALPAPKDD